MPKLGLAVGAVLLITTGIVLAVMMAVTPRGTPGVIGPAVEVGSAATRSAAASATSGSAGDDHVHPVPPSPAVQVTDDHGGGRHGGGRPGD